MSLDTISIWLALGDPDGDNPGDLLLPWLPAQEGVCSGKEDGPSGSTLGQSPALVLGGTGGERGPGADKDQLRPGLSSAEGPSSSWETLLGSGQKWTGTVLRRLKTVLGLGTGFRAAVSPAELLSMAARSGAELFLKTWKGGGAGTPARRSLTDRQRSRLRSAAGPSDL